jgi:hypothetical protein
MYRIDATCLQLTVGAGAIPPVQSGLGDEPIIDFRVNAPGEQLIVG